MEWKGDGKVGPSPVDVKSPRAGRSVSDGEGEDGGHTDSTGGLRRGVVPGPHGSVGGCDLRYHNVTSGDVRSRRQVTGMGSDHFDLQKCDLNDKVDQRGVPCLPWTLGL